MLSDDNELCSRLDTLIDALNENTEICKYLAKMLSQNNQHTAFLYEQKKVDLTGTQMVKNFGIDVAANIVADYITNNKDK